MGVFIVFVKAHLDILSLHFPDEPYYRPPLTPPKNPIKREKKKLAYSSEREDFIQSGEDRFARILRVLGGVLLGYCKTLSISLYASKQTASPLQGRRERGKNMRSIVFLITDPLYLPLKRGGQVCLPLESVMVRRNKSV